MARRLLSKFPLDDIRRGLPGDDDDIQARYIDAIIDAPGQPMRVACLYLPNGNPVASEKFPNKINWMNRLEAHAEALLDDEMPLVLAGDYNIIPEAEDCYSPAAWRDDALFQPESRDAYKRLKNRGLTDALRACDPHAEVYTFWDYQAGAWQKNHGIRIDHLLLSPQAADLLVAVEVDKHTRSWEKPSDHVPVVAEFSLPA